MTLIIISHLFLKEFELRPLKLLDKSLTIELTSHGQISRYIDLYDVTLDVCLPSEKQQAYVLTQLVYTLHPYSLSI